MALIALSPLGSSAQQGVLFINEVMAANSGVVQDATGEGEDWIELFNSSGAAIDVSGMHLSDDPEEPAKHILPMSAELIVPAGGYLLLWASGDPTRGATHLNFKLSSTGENILLSSATGSLIDLVPPIEHFTDVSYGRAGDGGGQWAYFSPPSPNSPNAQSGFQGRLDPPSFSVPAGFHSGSISLAITHPDPAVTIYYSTDGSTPGPEFLQGQTYSYKNTYPNIGSPAIGAMFTDTMRAYQYTGPLTLSDPTSSPNELSMRTATAHTYHPANYMPQAPVRKAHVILARAFRNGFLPSEVVSSSYFFTPDGLSPYTLPVLSAITQESNLFDFQDGIYNAGIDYEQWRINNPNTLIDGYTPANWTRNTEFPIALEWFEAGSGQRAFSHNAGFRLHGSFSKTFRRKSLRLYFREEYGPDDVGYAIFPDQPDTDHKRLVVHISGNDDPVTNMRDMTIQAMLKHMRFITQSAQPAVLFLGGEFWGVHAMRDRYDEKYFENELGLGETEIDVVERFRHASIGDSIAWSALLDQVDDQDPMDPAVFADLKTKIDIEDNIDYHVAQVYIGNFDWPLNNWKAYRKRTNGFVPDAPYGHDGRWRWLMFDTDWGFNLNTVHPPEAPMLAWATDPVYGEHTLLFRRLLRNQEYSHGYINRAADMINTAFRPEVINGIIEDHRAMLQDDMVEHITRWPDSPWNIGNWHDEVDEMVYYGSQRADRFRDEIQDYFELPAQHALQVDVSDVDAGWVKVNTIDLLPTTHGVATPVYPWNGTYYQTVPITLAAHAFPGSAFSHWEGAVQGTDSVITVSMTEAMNVTAVFEPAPYCAAEVVHYWHFNSLAGGSVTQIAPDQSNDTGALITYEGTGTGYLDATPGDEGSSINALENVPAGSGLRARDPSTDRVLVIGSPADGHRDITLSFATRRTSAGADSQQVHYTIDPLRLEWIALGEPYAVPDQYITRSFSLDGVISTYDNTDLAFKIEFLGPNTGGPSGNNRFDNVKITGRPVGTVEGLLCGNETTFSYQGQTYAQGDHIITDAASLDCGNVTLLRVQQAVLDTTVMNNGDTLIAMGEASSYQWIDCSGMQPVPGATGAQFIPAVEADYAVQIGTGNCSATSECHYSAGDQGMGISVYPNPADGSLFIGIGAHRSGRFTLVDATGRIVRKGILASAVNEIDLRDLSAASYFLHVSVMDGDREKRWTKVILK